MKSSDNHDWEQDVSHDFHAMMTTIREDLVPADSVERCLKAAESLAQSGRELAFSARPSVSNAPEKRIAACETMRGLIGRWSLVRSLGVLSAVLVIALLLSFTLLPQRTALANVIEAIAKKPWMRLTLLNSPSDVDEPVAGLPYGEGVTMWISGDRRTFAVNNPQDIRWAELESYEEWVFHRGSKSLVRGNLSKDGGQYIDITMTMLDQLGAPLELHDDVSREVVSQEQKRVSIDGRSWDVFVFRVENRTAPVHAETLELRVDRETHQPVELKRWLVQNGQKSMHHSTFVIDYPERGAEDVYALGAPRDVPVLDMREIQRFFVERQWPEPVNYKAIEFWTWTGEHELKNAKNPHRYRHNGAGTMVEQAAFADWMDALARNENRKHSIEWWIEKIELAHWETYSPNTENELLHRRLAFGVFRSTSNGVITLTYPHGQPSEYRSIHAENTLPGLQGTIELRGPKRSVWLDPERDMIVRRTERVVDDEFDPVAVTQFDEVVKDPAGVWFPSRWRIGRVAKRGQEIDNSFRGSEVMNTQQWIAEIEFTTD